MVDGQVRILIVDDHPIVRDGLVSVLGTQADFDVVGEVGSGEEALRQIDALQPSVVLLDLEMPGLDGVDVLHTLQQRAQPVPVLVFTAFDTDDRIVEAVRAGAKGYLLKGAPRADLFNAIRVVHAGGSLLQPVIATRLMQQIGQPSSETGGALSESTEQLTDREIEVLGLLNQGATNREIASRLTITERTVKFHVSSILAKLGASNRTEAVVIAREQGLTRTP